MILKLKYVDIESDIPSLQFFKVTSIYQLMFEKQRINLELSKQIKIHQIKYVLNGTFLLLHVDNETKRQVQITHLDANGNILHVIKKLPKIYLMYHLIFQMISPHELMMSPFLISPKKIKIVNLIDYKTQSFSLSDQCLQTCTKNHKTFQSSQTQIFSQTNMIAFKQRSLSFLRISFYNIKNIQEIKKYYEPLKKPIKQYCFAIDEQSSRMEQRVQSVNNSSLMAVQQIREGKKFITFLNEKKQLFSLEQNIFLQLFKKDEQMKIYLGKFYEVKPNCYLFTINYKNKNSNQRGLKYGLLNMKNNETFQNIKEISLFNQLLPTINHCIQHLNQCWVFYGRINEQKKPSSLFFFDQSLQQCLKVDDQETQLQCIRQTVSYPWYQKNTFIRALQTQPKILTIIKTTMFSRFTVREISMEMLLHINEDFDDDLLMDTIELLS